MKILDLDLGPSHPWLLPRQGQVLGSQMIEGAGATSWARGGQPTVFDVMFWAAPWQGIGGQSAGSIGAARYLLKQVEELAANPALQPLPIQWTTSGASGAFSRDDEHDGWYVIQDFEPNYRKYIVGGVVECRMTAILIAPMTVPMGVGYRGGALSTTYSGAAWGMIGFPIGAGSIPIFQRTRVGGEGTIPYSILTSPGTENPVGFQRPGTVAALITGGVRAFDTINTSTNPISTAGGVYHANWVEVKGPDHQFQGDLIVTNGLLLLLFQAGQNAVPAVYMWNTSGTPAWLKVGEIWYNDSVPNTGVLRDYKLDEVGVQEVRLSAKLGTAGGRWARLEWGLCAAAPWADVDWWSLSEANARSDGLEFRQQSNVRVAFNPTAIRDVVLEPNTVVAASSDYGYGAALGTVTNQPLTGWLYQNAPSVTQPYPFNTTIPLGDANGPAQNSFRRYAIFAVPWVSCANHTAEAESGTLGTGWTSAADAGSSGGNAAKCASGTASGNADLWGTAFVPTAGSYNLWVHARVTSAASSTSQMQIGLWNSTDSVFVASTTYAPNNAAFGTGYKWVKVAANVTPTVTKNMRVRAVTTATTDTDWWIDESFLAPVSGGDGHDSFPQDLWQQWKFRRAARWSFAA